MSDWDQQFAAMRAQFLTRARDRLSEAARAIDRLHSEPSDRQMLCDVRRHFHWLSGVGGTYKLPEVSDLGATAEELCDRFIGGQTHPSRDDVDRLRELLKQAQVILTETTS